MTRLWNICAFIALANLVALIGLLVWMASTGRIDSDRVDRVRALFAQPVEVERLAAEAQRQAEELEREASLEADSMVGLPASSRWPIDAFTKIQMERQRMERRFRDQLERDGQEILRAEQQLNAERDAFEREKAEYQQNQEQLRVQQESAEFKQAVKDLESMPAKSAKNLIVETCATGPEGIDLALRWMKGMRQGTRATIIASMKSAEELKLASSLLKSLAVPSAPGGPAMETPDETSITDASSS
ncbi:MAG: hypothetical protein CBC35_11385 [Planctomycetes bacterium TMED75]|nr:hypothetical protein [Planctomycetaceae bacterium]OUU90636.1 MAG: hypothetical protein CBC35_11385 [Planctomycetes bacterium TMED75]